MNCEDLSGNPNYEDVSENPTRYALFKDKQEDVWYLTDTKSGSWAEFHNKRFAEAAFASLVFVRGTAIVMGVLTRIAKLSSDSEGVKR